jgi:hypothetical protein
MKQLSKMNIRSWVRTLWLAVAEGLKTRKEQPLLHHLVPSIFFRPGLLSLPQPAFPINFLYTVSSVSASNLVSSTWAQDCM